MNDLVSHVLFFLALSVPIVVMSAFYTHAEDGPAFRSFPRRYAIFVLSCVAVAVVMLVLETLFASVS